MRRNNGVFVLAVDLVSYRFEKCGIVASLVPAIIHTRKKKDGQKNSNAHFAFAKTIST